MKDTIAAKLAHTGFNLEAKLARACCAFDTGDWKLVPRMFTHWKYKSDRKYTIINIRSNVAGIFLLTFFLRFYVTWEVMWFTKLM